jgi:hypothetical protein
LASNGSAGLSSDSSYHVTNPEETKAEEDKTAVGSESKSIENLLKKFNVKNSLEA